MICIEHQDKADSFNDFILPIYSSQFANYSMDVATESFHVQSDNSECKVSFHDIDEEFLLKQLLSLGRGAKNSSWFSMFRGNCRTKLIKIESL